MRTYYDYRKQVLREKHQFVRTASKLAVKNNKLLADYKGAIDEATKLAKAQQILKLLDLAVEVNSGHQAELSKAIRRENRLNALKTRILIPATEGTFIAVVSAALKKAKCL